jgi:uncharacterized membrane protein
MTEQQQIDQYLSVFRSNLRSVTLGEREEILREIGAHIRDSVEEGSTDVASVLERLGTPEELAMQYRDGILVRHASRSFSPLLLLQAALRLATKGAFGILIFFCGIFGYAFGIGMALTGFIKAFSPVNTGTWVQDGRIVSSGALIKIPPPPAHEIFGFWYVPIALTVGVLLILVTTFVIRRALRVSQRWQVVLGGPAPRNGNLTAGIPNLQ